MHSQAYTCTPACTTACACTADSHTFFTVFFVGVGGIFLQEHSRDQQFSVAQGKKAWPAFCLERKAWLVFSV
jgi:hypothetical protein